MNHLEESLAKIFLEKLPPLSENVKAPLAKYLPWVIIVFSVLGLLSWLTVIGMFNVALAVAGTAHVYGYGALTYVDRFIIYLLAPVIQLLSLVGGYWMLSRQLKGWRLILITQLISIFAHLVYFSLFGLVIDLVFLYILFQIKGYYSDPGLTRTP